MVVIPGPVEFVMGSPSTEAGRQTVELQHKKRIGRTFAIAAKAVTKEQFLCFLPTFSAPGDAALPRPDLSDRRRGMVRGGGVLQLVEQAGGHSRTTSGATRQIRRGR